MFCVLKNHASKVIRNHFISDRQRLFTLLSSKLGTFEPHDLKLTPDIPEYEQIQIVVRGHDYPVLESYAKYVHSVIRGMFLESDIVAYPPEILKVQTFKPNSSVVASEYFLKKYARAFKFDDLPSTVLPVLLEMMHTHVPQGVDITLGKPDPDEDAKLLYVPSTSKEEILKKISALNESKKDKRKKTK